MIRTACFAAFFVCAGIGFASDTATSPSAAGAAPRSENTTYVDGNVPSLKPNTGGTLVFTDEKSILFRTGLADVAVPYSTISRAELGATQEHSHDSGLPGPLKVLPIHLHKTETQLLTLQFKNGLGDVQTMTLSLAKPAANNVLTTIEERTGKAPVKNESVKNEPVEKPARAKVASAKTDPKDSSKDAWWGDSYWKTNRNVASWDSNKPSN